jgi:hypothetical protein
LIAMVAWAWKVGATNSSKSARGKSAKSRDRLSAARVPKDRITACTLACNLRDFELGQWAVAS